MEGYRSSDETAAKRLRGLLGAIMQPFSERDAEISREDNATQIALVLGSSPEYASDVMENLAQLCERYALGDVTAAEFGLYLGMRIGEGLGWAKAMGDNFND
jgi:hypothetical protein